MFSLSPDSCIAPLKSLTFTSFITRFWLGRLIPKNAKTCFNLRFHTQCHQKHIIYKNHHNPQLPTISKTQTFSHSPPNPLPTWPCRNNKTRRPCKQPNSSFESTIVILLQFPIWVLLKPCFLNWVWVICWGLVINQTAHIYHPKKKKKSLSHTFPPTKQIQQI